MRRSALGVAAVAVLAGAAIASCAPAPQPEPAPGPQPGQLWVGDVETGDLSQFAETPWNTVYALDPVVVSDGAYVREGHYSVGMTIPGASDDGTDTRSELQPDVAPIEPDDDLWFGFSTMLGEGFPVDQSWQVIAQWKNKGTGSPPVSVTVADNQFFLQGGAGHPEEPVIFEESLGRAAPGEWVDWTVHIRFSDDPQLGSIDVWRDGQQVLERFRPPVGTMYPDEEGASSYFKLGYYRAASIAQSGTVYFDDVLIGERREAVSRSG